MWYLITLFDGEIFYGPSIFAIVIELKISNPIIFCFCTKVHIFGKDRKDVKNIHTFIK